MIDAPRLVRAVRIAAPLAAILLPVPACAEAPELQRDFPIEEIAEDLSYGFCPLYLAGQFPLIGNSELQQRGFGEDVRKTPNERFGELEQVTAVRPDGNVAFGGVPQKVCSITITGAAFEPVLARLRSDMAFMGLDFQPDPDETGDRGIAKLETFKAPVEGKMLYVQLVRVSNPQPAVVVQMFGMAD